MNNVEELITLLKPPISRMGGKSKLRKLIISLLPEHICYTEPFFGAGWVFFGKPKSEVEVINDIDKELINLFRMIKFHSDEICNQMQYELSSRDMFSFYAHQDPGYMTEIQRAIRYIFLLSQSFASRGVTYGYGTSTRPAPQIFDTSQLAVLKDRLRNVYIENLSFLEIFSRYDRSHTIHFCDPPYYETDGYTSPFSEHDHLQLLSVLSNINGKFLLTINDHPKVREWYSGFNFIETEVNYSVAKKKEARRKYKELIITNYPIPGHTIRKLPA